jgi:hypothetical protein
MVTNIEQLKLLHTDIEEHNLIYNKKVVYVNDQINTSLAILNDTIRQLPIILGAHKKMNDTLRHILDNHKAVTGFHNSIKPEVNTNNNTMTLLINISKMVNEYNIQLIEFMKLLAPQRKYTDILVRFIHEIVVLSTNNQSMAPILHYIKNEAPQNTSNALYKLFAKMPSIK